MAEEKAKLGPNVTYVGNDPEDKEAVTVSEIRFKPGEAVNLVDRLGEARAKPILEKLSGNKFFKVDGGPDHEAEAKKRAEAEQKEQEAIEKDREEAAKEAQAKAQGDQPARKSGQAEQAKEDRAQQGYIPPETETLERQTSKTALTEGGATKTGAKK